MPIQADRIWSLTEENEIVAKQTWGILLKQYGYGLDNFSFADLEKRENFVPSNAPNKLPVLDLVSLLSSLPPVSRRTKKTFKRLNGNADYLLGDLDPSVKWKPSEFHPALEGFNSPQLHQTFLSSLRNDSPDNEILRFLRARRFKLLPALEMIVASLRWKSKSHPVTKWLMEGDAALAFSGKYPEVINAFRMEKFYLRGHDDGGDLICVIKVKDHFGRDCPAKDLEILICLLIEYTRLCSKCYSKDISETNILFDLSGFSLQNVDFHALKFLSASLDANYPENLCWVWVHKAPWVFNAVWKVIKRLLDPVVASKIHFTRSIKDLETFVAARNIPRNLGGLDDFVPRYVPPTVANSRVRPADEEYYKLVAEREQLLMAFIDLTIAWINAQSKQESTELLHRKIQLGGELGQNYVHLDPYIRSRGPFDRDGTIAELSI